MNVYPFGHAHGYDKLKYFEFPNLEAPLGKFLYLRLSFSITPG
jgi:hypothetical protein